TSSAGMIRSTLPLVGFGTEAMDVDNDGGLELFLINGHVDVFSRAGEQVAYAQPVQIFRHTGNRETETEFEGIDPRPLGDYFRKPHVGRSLWTVDANRDGKVDLVTTHQTEPVSLLINRTSPEQSWMRIRLVGTSASRDAIGAMVAIETSAGPRVAGLFSGGGYQCSNERVLHFGLGTVGLDEISVSVTWPNGNVEEFHRVKTRAETTLIEGQGG
ncbi:MAG: CRTAC1 family protein, partial [Planctomycetota bacterium]